MSNSGPPGTVNFCPDGTLVIVSGPSGAGKTTLVRLVREYFAKLNNNLHFSVSHTTRSMRAGEVDGTDYYFVDRATFEAMQERGEFIESAHVHGHLYGTSRKEVEGRLAQNQDVILDIDVQGAKIIADDPDLRERSVSVFVFPPTFKDLERRLRARSQNSEQEIEIRLSKAFKEIEEGFDYYNYVIINDVAEIAADCLKSAIIAKKLKKSSALERLRIQFKEEERGRITRGS